MSTAYSEVFQEHKHGKLHMKKKKEIYEVNVCYVNHTFNLGKMVYATLCIILNFFL